MGRVIKWFLATLAVGLIPMIMRLLVHVLLKQEYIIPPLLITDVIIWGLVLNISVFNERHGHFRYDPLISDISSAVSIVLIVLFSAMFIFSTTNEAKPLFKENVLYVASVLFACLTLVLCIIYICFCYPYLNNRAVLKSEKKKPKEKQ